MAASVGSTVGEYSMSAATAAVLARWVFFQLLHSRLDYCGFSEQWDTRQVSSNRCIEGGLIEGDTLGTLPGPGPRFWKTTSCFYVGGMWNNPDLRVESWQANWLLLDCVNWTCRARKPWTVSGFCEQQHQWVWLPSSARCHLLQVVYLLFPAEGHFGSQMEVGGHYLYHQEELKIRLLILSLIYLIIHTVQNQTDWME